MFFLPIKSVGRVAVISLAMLTAPIGFAETPADSAENAELELDGHTLVVADRVDARPDQLPGAKQEHVRAEVLDALHSRLKSEQVDS